MADFKIAISITLQHEGGYVDNPNDPGGATNFGITQADMPGKDMKTLTVDEAVDYYAAHYWKSLYDQITDQNVANKLFDMGVLFGVGEAAYLLQRALGFLKNQWTKTFDTITLISTNNTDADVLLADYKAHLLAHVNNLVAATPTNAVFKTGWTSRVNS